MLPLFLIPLDEYGFAAVSATKASGMPRQNAWPTDDHLEPMGYLQRKNRVGAGESRTSPLV